jgi:hypothetical protein
MTADQKARLKLWDLVVNLIPQGQPSKILIPMALSEPRHKICFLRGRPMTLTLLKTYMHSSTPVYSVRLVGLEG